MRTITAKAITLLITLSIAAFAQQKGTFTDSRDKKTYKTVKIGEQVWMAENLNYEASDSKCYDNKPDNCAKYGRLYSWETAKSACPTGWHLPLKAEWEALVTTAGGENTAGKNLKATSGWNENGNGTDKFGFSALPGGFGFSDGSFSAVGEFGDWRSVSEPNGLLMSYNNDVVGYSKGPSSNLYSVRCLQGDAKEAEAKVAAAKAAAEAKVKADADATKAAREAYVKANGGTFTDSRDKKTYKTIKIDEQVWMAENLNYADKNSKCYDNKPDNCAKYGRMYNLPTAKLVCPKGWHLPSKREWDILLKFADPSCSANEHCDKAGTKLKAASGWDDYKGKSPNGTDDYGFSALPGGFAYLCGKGGCILDSKREFGDLFHNGGRDGVFWIRSDNTYDNNASLGVYGISYGSSSETLLYSVRCLQGDEKEAAAKEAAAKAEAEAKQAAAEAAAKAEAEKPFTDSRDKKTYKPVKIGNQIWMSQNLNYEAKGSKCYADGKYGVSADSVSKNCAKYGRLYDWQTAKSACPTGWHLPSKQEWETLTRTVGDPTTAGKLLKAKSSNGEDKFGFAALPGGGYLFGSGGGAFMFIGIEGNWWSSSEYQNNEAYLWNMNNNYDHASDKRFDKNSLYSIRCIKNDGTTPQPTPQPTPTPTPQPTPQPTPTPTPQPTPQPAPQPKQTEQPKQQSSNENCSITFPKKSCVSMPKGTCKMAGGKVVEKCP